MLRNPKITYRPEIDGLRAIAVISVVLFHADFALPEENPFPGGYLGVDVFFVISGYLISLLILKGLGEKSFSFADFYERRARRILPVLFTVMIASLPFAWFYLLPQELIEYANSVVYSILFSSNFWFWFEDPYWATNSSLKPFLHTWSLAVEEQFYFVMPVLLISLHRFVRRALLPVLGVLAIASLAYAQWASSAHPEFAFYMLPTRMWELLAGSLLAALEIKAGRESRRVWMREIIPAVGVALICVSMVFFNEKTQHPSLLTLVPIGATMMVIWYSQKGGVITRLLSSKLFVGTGLISYGLYLWHYPMFSFGQMIFDKPGNVHKFLFISAAFAISICTFFLIERPFRNKQRVNIKVLVLSLSLAMSSCLVFMISGISTEGFDDRFAQLNLLYGKNEFDNNKLRDKRRESVKFNKFSSTNTKKVLILGDSHARDMFLMFWLNEHLFPEFEFAIPSNHVSVTPKSNKCFVTSESKRSAVVRHDNYKQSDIIVISESYSFDPKILEKQLSCLSRLVDLLKGDGKQVVVTSKNVILPGLRQVPKRMVVHTGEWDHFTTLYSRRTRLRPADLFLLTNGAFTMEKFERYAFNRIREFQAPTDDALEELSRQKGVKFLKKMDYLCDLGKRSCELFSKDGYKLRFDKGHHTIAGNKHFGQKIAELGWFNVDQ